MTVPCVETKLVGSLTERQRLAIADALTSLQGGLAVV
jgi:hypothetical protein